MQIFQRRTEMAEVIDAAKAMLHGKVVQTSTLPLSKDSLYSMSPLGSMDPISYVICLLATMVFVIATVIAVNTVFDITHYMVECFLKKRKEKKCEDNR